MPRYAVILPAAGKSSRFGDKHYKKPFAPLDGRPVWLHCAEKFVNRDDVSQVVLVIAPEDREHFQEKFAANAALLGIAVVSGGDERFQSVENGLDAAGECDFVAIHDAARPCLAHEWIDRVFRDAAKYGAAILATPISSTLKKAKAGESTIESTVSRENMWAAQTPQVFRREWLEKAFAERGDRRVTDEAELVEAAGFDIHLTPGSPINLKITDKGDLKVAAQLLKALPAPKLGGPTHPFEDGDLWR